MRFQLVPFINLYCSFFPFCHQTIGVTNTNDKNTFKKKVKELKACVEKEKKAQQKEQKAREKLQKKAAKKMFATSP